MANPPVNRRPGVDADIFQGEWVRGYDVPAGDQTVPPPAPVDLIVSNGKSQITQAVSDLIFASRTDSPTQPIFVLAQGSDPTAPIARLNFHIGNAADPNGVVAGVSPGSLYASYGTPGLWQVQSDSTTWVQISDNLGGEDLQQTLAIGNFTGGFDIRITSGDRIIGVDDVTGVGGASVTVQGGAGAAGLGNGGTVFVSGGTSVGGITGRVALLTPVATHAGATGTISLTTGDSLLGGNSGAISIRTGNAGAAGTPGSASSITVGGGNSLATGSLNSAGSVTVSAGFAQTVGQGGRVFIVGGNATGATTPIIVATTAGQGGEVRLLAGSSAGTRPGGAVQLQAGTGGSAGAVGGNVVLTPGAGGGGFAAGEVIASGVFRADNVKRGNGDPNAFAVPGNEGDVYQRLDTGLGQLWLNTNGSPTGWRQLAFSGDFVESFEQMQWGYLTPAGVNPTGNAEDDYADVGLWEGMRESTSIGGVVNQGAALTSGPVLDLVTGVVGTSRAAIELPTGFGNPPHAVEHQFIATFRIRNSVPGTMRAFVGFSSSDAATHLAAVNANPGAPDTYVGFIADSNQNGNWRVVTANGLGTSGPFDTGVSLVTTSTLNSAYYFVIDTVDYLTPVIRFFILDPSLNLVASVSVPTTVPSNSTRMRPIIGISTLAAASRTLSIQNASIVNQANLVAQGGGVGASAPTLAEVLVNGNETGATLVQVNQGSGLLGVTDDDAGDGASFSIFGGATTGAGNNTGAVTLASGNAFGGGAVNAGATTGAVLVASGSQLVAASLGDTGDVTVQSGDHTGTDGTTGDLVLRSGLFSNGAAGTRTQGDVLIAPGGFVPDTSTVTGEVIVKGGSSSVAGVAGGDVTVWSGENNSASGDTGDILVETFSVNLVGNSGDLTLRTGAAGSNSGNSGDVSLESGDAVGAGNTGTVVIGSGDAPNGAAGSLAVAVGLTTVGPGSPLTLSAGDTTAGGQLGGRIILNPGTGPGGNGDVQINGKLTVSGLIDPTGLLLDGQAAVPSAVAAGQGLLWIDNTAAPSRLFYTDDAGIDHNISTGGGVTALDELSDVTITGPVPGEVLTYNGVNWVNLPGAGGSPLATILGIGNTTGAQPIVVSDSVGSRITSDGDLAIQPAAGPGNAVILDGIRWPEADGAAGFVLTTNGAGQLSFQAAGGAAGDTTFAEAFAQMQWGSLTPPADTGAVANQLNGAGILHDHDDAAPAGATVLSRAGGLACRMSGSAAGEAGFITTTTVTRADNLGLFVWKFEISSTTNVRLFLGLTGGSRADMVLSDAPATPVTGYVGLGYSTSVPDAGFVFWHSSGVGAGTRLATGVAADTGVHYFSVDASVPGQFTLTLYDADFTSLVEATIGASIPSSASTLSVMGALRPLGGINEALFLYSCTAVHRADLLGSLGGGGGSQGLASVLGFGNDTGGLAIQGTNNGAGSGLDLDLAGGSSTGAGGSGGAVTLLSGSPDPGGDGDGGNVSITTASGAGNGDAGDVQIVTGNGGGTGGIGGEVSITTGNGTAAFAGGRVVVTTGDGGGGGGVPGAFEVVTGDATGGNVTGARIDLRTGDGFGTGNGGSFLMIAGDGGAAGGNGGGFTFATGAGNGGGSAGEFTFNGDMTVSGKLTVTGMIDPPGLLMSSSGAVPFTPAGTEGGIWVNNAGELVYTNLGGSLNLSTAIGGGMTFLEALLTAGYGFLGPGNPAGGAQSYGVYGSSVVQAVSPGPPPASITFNEDTGGPFLNLAVAANPLSEAFVSTTDLFVRRDQQFRARFKFQVTSPAHTDERIFIGFTQDASLVTPSTQLSTDDPAALEYFGLREDLAGLNLNFVARGSGGAMTPVLAIPTDAQVHYLEIDASDASGDVTFTVYAEDGVTQEATHTEPASFLLPSLALSLRPFLGIHTGAGTTPRGIDFYFSSIVTRADVVDSVAAGGGSGGTPPLAAVLAAGNTTGGNAILVDSTIEGDGVTLALVGGFGGAGNPAQMSLDASVGDNGGDFAALGGAGVGVAGNGGDIQMAAGDGSGTGDGGNVQFTAGAADSGGGDGGDVQMVAGNATGVNGAGGDIDMIAGNSEGLSDGGAITLVAGVGGGSGGAGAGGSVSVIAGSAAGSGLEGGISLLTGASSPVAAPEGAVQAVGSPAAGDALSSASILVSAATSTLGGGVAIAGGRGPAGSGADGGTITITAAAGDGAGDSGRIHLLCEGATPVGVAAPFGDVQLVARTETGASLGGYVAVTSGGALLGGSATIGGGDATAAGVLGGSVVVTGGTGNGAAPGGFALIRGGQGGATGDGGDVQVRGGNSAGGANAGGDVRLIPGTAPGGDGVIRTEGVLRVEAAIDASSPGVQFGAFITGGGPGPFIVPFNVAFGAAPTSVTFSIETAVPVASSIALATVTAAQFVVAVSAPLAVGDVIHWTAYL